MLPRHHRLTRPREFSAVLRGGHGRRAGTALLVVHSRTGTDPGQPARVGFIVSGAVGNSVVRHRVTRRLRALFQHRMAVLPGGTDLVVRANPAAAAASSAELASALDRALERVLPTPAVSR